MDSIFCYINPDIPDTLSGSLQGRKIATQPNIQVAGWPAEAGSQALAGFKALEDAAVIERLTKNGAKMAGATHMSEFGFGLVGSTAGLAIAQKDADAELMLDLAGEIRLAAAHAGLWGFKPGYGVVPRVGITGLIPSMEACGILGKTPGDIRAILQAVAGPDERDFSQPDQAPPDFSQDGIEPGKITLGVIDEAINTLSVQDRDAFEKEMDELKKAGFSVKFLSWPDYALCLMVHQIVGSVEASSCAGRYDSVRYGKRAPGAKNWNEMYLQSRGESFGTLLKSYLIQGAFFQFERYDAYEDACRIRARMAKDTERLAVQASVLVFPVQNAAAPDAPDTLAGLYEQFAHTAHANITGCPALCMPPSAANRPAIQLVGLKNADARVMALGEYLYQQRKGGN
ncbi:MAG TPA: amidase family protein [Smithellaceae bacterium]|nr:amidase family protein [Smithellaceae bacterium]